VKYRFIKIEKKENADIWMRADGRAHNVLRPVSITRNYIPHAEGSVLIEIGNTKVIATASVEEKVPFFLKGVGQGWVTAEYGMIPRSTETRMTREVTQGKPGGRTMEIQRLIGRSLRAVVDLSALGERTIWIDCDIICADGGTRTASITGGFIALVDALVKLKKTGKIKYFPLKDYVAAISVGIVNGKIYLDLDYREDSAADVDMNFVMTGSGLFVEIQGTAEKHPFADDTLFRMIETAKEGIKTLIGKQKEIFGGIIE